MPEQDHDLLEDAISRALAPYAWIVPRATLERMRENMREYATTHPYPVALVRQMSEEPATQGSHTRATDPDADEEAPAPVQRLRVAKGGRG